MIEYYTLMNKGSESLYRDDFHLNFGPTITILMLYVSKKAEVILDSQLTAKLSSTISSCNSMTFEEISNTLEGLINNQCDYLLFQINDSHIQVERHGNIYVELIKNGELKRLPNGIFTLENDDHIVCGTSSFFKGLTGPAIVADALSSISSEEWMDGLCFRIAEKNGFSEGNLTAATLIVRKD